MNLFDIIGPVMIGPSSSHTAGAARIGRLARRLLDEQRANFMAESDYSEGGTMEHLIQMILKEVSAHSKLEDLEGIIQ